MSTELTYNQALELLPLYVLGALEPDEMLAVDAVIQAHPEIQARLDEIEETVSQLAFAAPSAPLPLDARQQLLQRARGNSAEAAHPPAPVAVPRERTPLAAQPPTARRSWFAGFNRWAVATVCALLALVLLGSYTLQLQNQLAQLSEETATLRQSNQQLQEQLVRGQEYLARVIEADRSVALASTQPGLNARGAFTLNGDQGEFVVSGLAPLPPDQTYQAWLVPPGGTPTSVGLLSVEPDGTATLRVSVPAGLRNFSIADVSIERAGGSDVITKETIVLRGAIS